MDGVIGQIGKYQLFMYLAARIVEIPCGVHSIYTVFGAATPKYRCETCFDKLENTTFDHLSYEDDIDNTFFTSSKDKCNITTISQCKVSKEAVFEEYFSEEISECCGITNSTDQNYSCDSNIFTQSYSTPQTCDSYVYDNRTFTSTIVTEFDLVCENKWKTDLSTSIYYLGFGVGGIVGGILSDRYGRQPIMVLGALGMLIFGVACSFSIGIWTFSLFRFLIAFFVNVVKVSGFTYIMEMLGAKQRSYLAVQSIAIFAVGEILLAYPFAIIFTDWRNLQFFISLTVLPSLVLTCFVPKSYRWQVSQNKIEDAKNTAVFIAEKNRGEKIGKKERQVISAGIDGMANAVEKQKMKLAGKTIGVLDLFKEKYKNIDAWISSVIKNEKIILKRLR